VTCSPGGRRCGRSSCARRSTYGANWKVTADGGRATLTVDRYAPQPGDPADSREAIEAEGLGLLRFVVPGADGHRVEFAG